MKLITCAHWKRRFHPSFARLKMTSLVCGYMSQWSLISATTCYYRWFSFIRASWKLTMRLRSQFVISQCYVFKQPGLQIISEPSWTPLLLISMLKVLKGMQLVRIFLIAFKTCRTSSDLCIGRLLTHQQPDINMQWHHQICDVKGSKRCESTETHKCRLTKPYSPSLLFRCPWCSSVMAKELLLFVSLLTIALSPGTAYICSNDDSSPRDDFQNHICHCGIAEITPGNNIHGSENGDLYEIYFEAIGSCQEDNDNASIECAYLRGRRFVGSVPNRRQLTEIPVEPNAASIYSKIIRYLVYSYTYVNT